MTVVAGFTITILGLLYQLLAPSFWYSLYVDMEKSKTGSPQSGSTIGWVIGMFFPFFNFNQLYLDVTMRSSGANDPVSGQFRDGLGIAFLRRGFHISKVFLCAIYFKRQASVAMFTQA